MRILLLGCTGFIGKELIPKLIDKGHELCIVSRRNINQIQLNVPLDQISFLKLNLSIQKNWQDINLINQLKRCEGIINLTGEPIADKRWDNSHKTEIEESRINTTKFLMKNLAILKINPKVIVNASAVGYYGTSLTNEFDENSPSGKDFLANLCNAWESEANKKPFFTRLVIFRIGIVLGSDGGALGKMMPIFKLGLGGPIGSGNQWMSWIHRTDMCSLIIEALTNKKYSGTYNAVAPDPVTMKIFSKCLAECLNRPNILSVPAIPLRILIGDGAKLVLEGQKVISKKLFSKNFKFKYPLLKQALSSAAKK